MDISSPFPSIKIKAIVWGSRLIMVGSHNTLKSRPSMSWLEHGRGEVLHMLQPPQNLCLFLDKILMCMPYEAKIDQNHGRNGKNKEPS